MKRLPTPSPLICICDKPTGKRAHTACIRARRQAVRERRVLVVIHTYLHYEKRGVDIQLELPAHRPLTPGQCRLLEDRFEVLELSGWLLPGGVQAIAPRLCRWKRVPRAVIDCFLGDLYRLLWPQSAPKPEPAP